MDVLLIARCLGAVLNGHKNGRITSVSCALDLRAGKIMERDDCKIAKVVPSRIKEASPVKHQAIDNGATIELGAKCVEDQPGINWKGLKSTLDELECMRALKNRHAWFNLWVH